MRRALAIGLAWLTTATPGGAAGSSGIAITIGPDPTTLTCPVGAMCIRDDPLVRITILRGGLVVARAKTAALGRVRVHVAPGRYLAQLRYHHLGSLRVESARVNVRAGAYTA